MGMRAYRKGWNPKAKKRVIDTAVFFVYFLLTIVHFDSEKRRGGQEIMENQSS